MSSAPQSSRLHLYWAANRGPCWASSSCPDQICCCWSILSDCAGLHHCRFPLLPLGRRWLGFAISQAAVFKLVSHFKKSSHSFFWCEPYQHTQLNTHCCFALLWCTDKIGRRCMIYGLFLSISISVTVARHICTIGWVLKCLINCGVHW